MTMAWSEGFDRWGPGCEPPVRNKQRCDDTYISRPGWTVVDVRHGPHGKDIMINVDREPWDPPEL